MTNYNMKFDRISRQQ